MSGHVLAIVHKELVELKRMGHAKAPLIVAIAAILLLVAPLSFSTYSFETALWRWLVLVFLPSFPIFLVSVLAAESIAGERERHTLETLLASPVDGRTILIAKVLTHLLLAFIAYLFLLLVVLVAAIPGAGGGFPRFPVLALVASLTVFLLVFLAIETVGLFAGQRARTVASAQAVVAPFFSIPFLAILLLGIRLEPILEVAEAGLLAAVVWGLIGVVAAIVVLVILPLAAFVLRRARADRLLA